MKKKILPITILIALIASVVTFVVLLNVEKNMLSDFEQGLVWVLKEEMPAGTECTEESMAYYMEHVLVDLQNIPEQSIVTLGQLEGLRSAISLPKGSILTQSMFTGERDDIARMKNPVVAGCKAEDLYQLVSGSLRKGDRINLYTVNEEDGVVTLLWEDVLVYEVFDSAGKCIEITDEETAAARINILLEKECAEIFYTELYKGSLRVVKVC